MRRFRFRPFRSAMRAARLAPWIGRALLRRLRQAHRWKEMGRLEEAAAGFAEVEKSAWSLAPGRAALLAVEAGLAFLLAGDVERGRYHLDSGIAWLRQNSPDRAPTVAARAGRELRAAGLEQEAARLGVEPAPPIAASPHRGSGRLPSKCPYCGGGVLPAEAEWAEDDSVLCAYCGSRVTPAG